MIRYWRAVVAVGAVFIFTGFTSAYSSEVVKAKTSESAELRCKAMASGIGDLKIEKAVFNASNTLPAHCEVIGALNARLGSDGQAYAIRFHVRLPVNWNHRFFFQGGGGTDGDLGDATGRLGSSSALAMGYAVVSQDAGHDNAINTKPEKNGASAFGFDPQARRDYGRTSLKASADAARKVIASFYGDKPRYSYFVGCSKGGQEGMAFAQDYPEVFDGIVASAPGFSLPKAAIAEAWDTQTFGALVTRPGEAFNGLALYKAFSAEDLSLVRKAVLGACDKDDGIVDGIVGDYRACTSDKVVPQLTAITCVGDKTVACLTTSQVAALIRSHDGPRNRAGRPLYVDWPWSAGVSAEDWRIWKIGSSNGQIPALNILLGGTSLSAVFTSPPTAIGSDPISAGRYMWAFDFDRDAPAIFTTTSLFRTSAWSDISARSSNLDGFRERKGRMIVTHGTADPVFSINDTTAWYDEVNQETHNQASSFVRVYPVPDMGHCGGGVATDQYNVFEALVDWVEKGRAPQSILAKAGHATPWPDRKRPLCPYPTVARYKGGNIDDAASFQCQA